MTFRLKGLNKLSVLLSRNEINNVEVRTFDFNGMNEFYDCYAAKTCEQYSKDQSAELEL
jgi:hypothetical protein